MIMCLNARSLCIEKSDELFAVVRTNDVGFVCVTETWFKPYMSTESVGLAGFCCERKDRLEKGGGEWHVMWPRLFRMNVCTILKKMDAKSYG